MGGMRSLLVPLGITVIATALVVILGIYLTPLKNLDLIQPQMNDMDPAAFAKEYNANPSGYILIDVRSAAQYNAVHAKGSINIPVANLTDDRSTLPMHGKQIVLFCGDGRLAAIAYGYLSYYGFLNLIHIKGGLQQWIYEDLPVDGVGVFSTSTVQAALQ